MTPRERDRERESRTEAYTVRHTERDIERRTPIHPHRERTREDACVFSRADSLEKGGEERGYWVRRTEPPSELDGWLNVAVR